MTTVVITQPMLFPWPGFFEQLQLADVYIYLDDAQFSKGSFTNRVQLREANVDRWLTIPLAGKGSFQRICDLRPADDAWQDKHFDLATSAFKSAAYADSALDIMRQVYATSDLTELLIASVEVAARHLSLGGSRRVLRSSLMNVHGRSWQRVLDIVLSVGGTRYLTGHGAARYLDHSAFEAAGVAVEYADYSLTRWPRGDNEATPYLSILDLIAWTGARATQYLHPRSISWRDFLREHDDRAKA